MAERGAMAVFSKEQVEVASLKETLCAQQKLLQKLYNELEVEREASTTAASEALSMILRLQGEKGVVKMEAEQYKRLTKEKMCHAEESLSIFEDLIYQREMEIAALDYQVQAYRYKLVSLGCVDQGLGEIKFPENLLQRNESLVGDISGADSLGRRNSAPPFPLKYAHQKKGIIERENSTSPERDLISKMVEERRGKEVIDQGSDSEKKTDSCSVVGINSYWEQIRKLDERVKEIAGDNYANSRSERSSLSPVSQFSPGNSSEVIRVATMNNEVEQVKHPGASSFKNEINTTDPSCSPGVLDVFEVPQVDQHQTKCGRLQPKDEKKMLLQEDERLERPDYVPREDLKSEVKDETDRLKKLLKSSPQKNLHRHSDNVANGCCLAFVCPESSVAESQPKFNQLNIPSEIVEVEAQSVREESSGRGEELKLLNEIKVQLNAIQSEISSLKTKRSPPRDKQALVSFMETSLMEAMLHFWL